MEKFVVNGKAYFARELDFNFLADLDMEGIDYSKITGVAAMGFFLAYCSNGALTRVQANNEISQHILNGGKMDELSDAYKKALEESDFFRKLMGTEQDEQEEQEENPEEAQEEAPKKVIKKGKAVSE